MKTNVWKKLFITLAFCLCFALAGAGCFLLTACSNDAELGEKVAVIQTEVDVVYDSNSGEIAVTKETLPGWNLGTINLLQGFSVTQSSGVYTLSCDTLALGNKTVSAYMYMAAQVKQYTYYTFAISARANGRSGQFGVSASKPGTPTGTTIATASSESNYTYSFYSGSSQVAYLFFGGTATKSARTKIYVSDLSFAETETGAGVEKVTMGALYANLQGSYSGTYAAMPTEVTKDGYVFLGWSAPPVEYAESEDLTNGYYYNLSSGDYLDLTESSNGAFIDHTFYISSGMLAQVTIRADVSVTVYVHAFNSSNRCVGSLSASAGAGKKKQLNYFVPSGTNNVRVSCYSSSSTNLYDDIRTFLVDIRESYEQGKSYDVGDNLLVYDNHTLVASYGKQTFRVIYDTQGVQVNETLPTTDTLAYHTKINWSLPVLTSSDFQFKGWAGRPDGSGYYVSSGSSSNTQLDATNADFDFVHNTVTLYAIGVKKIAVMFDPNDGTNRVNLAYNVNQNNSGGISIAYDQSTGIYTLNGSGGECDIVKLVEAGNYSSSQTFTVVFDYIDGSCTYSYGGPSSTYFGLLVSNATFSYGTEYNIGYITSGEIDPINHYWGTGPMDQVVTFTAPTSSFKISARGSGTYGYTGSYGRTEYATWTAHLTNYRFKLAIYKGSHAKGTTVNPMAKMYNSDDRYGDLPSVSGLTREGYTATGWTYHSAPLPSEYQAVRYLESDGTQWINSGVEVTATTKIQAEIIFNEAFGYNMMYGAWSNFSLSLVATDQWCVGGGGTSTQNIGLAGVAKKFYQIEQDRGVLSLNGASKTLSSSNNTATTRKILLFAASNSGDTPNAWGGSYGKGRIYDFRIYNGSTIVRSFVPCYRKSDGKPGMYDFVTGEFFTNKGSGADFTCGVESSGIQSNSSMKVVANHTIYTQWTGNSYIVSFDANGGSVAEGWRSVKYQELYNKMTNIYPSDSESNFNSLHGSISNNIFTASKSNSGSSDTWYNFFSKPNTAKASIMSGAKYTYVIQVLSWNGGSALRWNLGKTDTSSATQLSRTSVDISGTGLYFVTVTGTGDSNPVYLGRDFITIPAGKTLDATFRVALFAGEITAGMYSGYVAPLNTITHNLPTPTRTGYDFVGWTQYSPVHSDYVYDSTRVTRTMNHTLYAKWSAKSVTFTLKLHTYAANGTTVTDGLPSGGQIQINYTKVSGGVASADEQTQTAASASYSVFYGSNVSYTITVPKGYMFIGINNGSMLIKPSLNYVWPTSGQLTGFTGDRITHFCVQAVQMEVKYDPTNKYYYYEDGEFPQTYVGNDLNQTLNNQSLTNYEYQLALGGYTINVFKYAGNKYAKITSTTSCNILINDGSKKNFTAGTYWFAVEPVRWRISEYGETSSWWEIGDTQTDVVGISNILGFGYLKANRDANYGDKAKDILQWKFNFNSNWFTNSFNSSYGASTYNLDTDQYNAQSSSTPVSTTKVSVAVDQKDSTTDCFYVASTVEIGVHINGEGTVQKKSFKVNASDLSAFLMQRDYTSCYGWTRDLENLGSAKAVGPNGAIVTQWFDTQLGYVFAHRITRGTRVS